MSDQIRQIAGEWAVDFAFSSSPVRARRALFLVNPKARLLGSVLGERYLAQVRDTLNAGGIELTEVVCTLSVSFSDTIRRRAVDHDLVIICGGDGTLNSAALGLADMDVPLGVVPLGTANDFARTLSIPSDPVAAARLIVTGTPRPVDLGEVNGHPFLNVASIGFSAELARALTANAKRRWGVLGYAITALRLLARARPFTARIEHDGVVETVRTLQVSVGNGRYYGGGMTISDTATADDGALDFSSLEVSHWWHLLRLLPSLRRGTHHRWEAVRAFRTTQVGVSSRRPRAVNTDGELTTWTPACFRIRPGALRVYAPAGPSSAMGGSRRMPAFSSSCEW